MGAFDGAEECELVGIYLLSILTTKCNKDNTGLYRDDGLAVFKDISGPQSEKLKKQFQKMFNENGLKIEIKCNLKIVNYLDVTLNLNDGTYKPYRKPNDETLYVHAKSNHPPNIIKEVPIAIEKRLCNLSASKEIFEEAAMHYQRNKHLRSVDITTFYRIILLRQITLTPEEDHGREILLGLIRHLALMFPQMSVSTFSL